MATNTFNSLNTDLLSQLTLKAIVRRFPLISTIGTDFSQGTAKFGQKVLVKQAVEVAATDYNKSAGGYVAADSTDSEVEVTIDKHIHVSRELTIEEAHSSDDILLQKFAELDAAAIVKNMVANLFSKIQNPAVPTATQQTVAGIGDFGRDTLVDINTALRERDVHDVGRFLVLNPAYYGALTKDATLIDGDTNPGNGIVQSSEVFTADGTSIQYYNGIPANGENLVGFSGVGESFAIAQRLPLLSQFSGEGFGNYKEGVATEATSGLSMSVVEYIDPKLGTYERSYRLMYGTEIGNEITIQKLASA